MLIGEFRCNTDDGGRLTIPSEFRAELGQGATVTRGVDRCLVVYPAAKWEKLAEKIERQLPLTSRLARAFNRLVFSGAHVCAPDQEGQIVLSGSLREYANIEDEVVVVGLFSHFEIWSPRRWQEMRSESLEDGVALAEELREFGI
jgi:MraZ protein